MIEALRDEIVETQKGRLDLFKWKLIISASLAAIGLGFGSDLAVKAGQATLATLAATAQPRDPDPIFSSMHLTLCLIPLACSYVDLLCVNLQLRMLVIGRFFEAFPDKKLPEIHFMKLYEIFCATNRNAYCLDDLAQFWSTAFVSLLIVIAGCFHYESDRRTFYALIVFGLAGVLLTFLIRNRYHKLHLRIMNHDLIGYK
jgi:hypothetical protein